MVFDILEIFEKEYQKSGDNLILGAYTLKDGVYIKIKNSGEIEYFEAKTIKKEKIFTTIDGIEDTQNYEWFKERDYYSAYLNSNKALFDKKIHSINYLSLFFKIENFDYVSEKMRDYFLILLSYKHFNKRQEKDVLKQFENYIKSCNRKRDLITKKEILENSFHKIKLKLNELDIKNYVKIFFDEDIEKYKKESEIYLSLKIFNDIKYNENVESEIFGLSNSNMGMNSKKPFLEAKSRKLKIPFLIKNRDAILLKKFFDWLKLQPYNLDRTLTDEFFIQKRVNNDEAEVTEFDYIPLKIDDVKKYFKPIYVKNYLKKTITDGVIEDYEIKDLWQLESKIDEVFYNKQLIYNYFKDDIKVSQFLSKELQKLLFITKTGMLNYFKKFNDSDFLYIIKKYSNFFVIENLRSGRNLKAVESLHLKFAILENRGEKIVNIEEIQKKVLKRLEESDYSELNRDEFFYLAGQVVGYLLAQSEAYQKNGDLLEPFLRANNSEKLKKDIEFTYFKYKHKIPLSYRKFANGLSLIMAYEKNEKLSKNMDSFLVGVLSNNIFFMKKEQEK